MAVAAEVVVVVAVDVVVGVAAVAERTHRIGIGWRPELAAGIFAHLDRIDVVEVLADNYFKASRRELDALRALATQVPVQLHGVGLGLASAYAVDTARLDSMARLIERVRPAGWSEHLAFVRAAGVEVGHLAMPPRTAHTVEQTVRNVEAARAVTGLTPALENIATLFDPPMSTLTEAEWSRQILREADAPMLLDLHNLYANAVNAGRDPQADLAAFPLERVSCVHLSGGMWISHDGGERRLLDDHVHSPPEAVFELLRSLELQTTASFDVVLERDGHYPSFNVMLDELDRARAALNPLDSQPVRRYA
jgi:uncharacterized protein (UPF0276 family)